MVDLYKGKTAAEWSALGKPGKARAASRGGQTGKKWTGPGADPYDRSAIEAKVQEDDKLRKVAQDTKKYQDWLSGSSGYTDVYRRGASKLRGPEVDIDDVDVHGYPEGWTQAAGTKDGEEGTWITPAAGHHWTKKYFKPTDTGGGGDGDTTTGGSGVVISGMQPFNLATLTDEMDLINVISNLVNRDSPLMKAAGTAAMQRLAKRGSGMLNSSIALRSVENAVISLAADIGSKHVDNLIANLEKNTQWTNDQRKQANDYVFKKMLNDINNVATLKLQGLKEASALEQQKYSGLADIMAAGDDAELSLASYWDEYMKRVGLVTATDTTDTAVV